MKTKQNIIPQDVIESKILFLRGKKVMLDRDLAVLYGIKTFRLNEQVKRNKQRFPNDFMFRLTQKETEELIAFCDRFKTLKHSSNTPYAFTQEGVAMLSSVLKSTIAINVNIQIMRAFVKMREALSAHESLKKTIKALEKKVEQKFSEHDQQFDYVFEAFETIKKMLAPETKPKRKIGFRNTD